MGRLPLSDMILNQPPKLGVARSNRARVTINFNYLQNR